MLMTTIRSDLIPELLSWDSRISPSAVATPSYLTEPAVSVPQLEGLKHKLFLLTVVVFLLPPVATTPCRAQRSEEATHHAQALNVDAERTIETDLLIVGETESACTAAVQAARMGVEHIALVNDIQWLGGQFSAEALMAIDENTYKTGVRHDPPIPRHGAFKEVIDRIEADNVKNYGVARTDRNLLFSTRPSE